MDAQINYYRSVIVDSVTIHQAPIANANINNPEDFPTQPQGHMRPAHDEYLTHAQGRDCDPEYHLSIKTSKVTDRLQNTDGYSKMVSQVKEVAFPEGPRIILDLLIESRTATPPKAKDFKS